MADNMSTCSILAASLCTYGIDEEGGVEGYYLADDVGFTGPVKTFTAGLKDIDACYVADTADSVILAFRGTALGEPGQVEQSIIDWLNNFMARPVETAGIPGKLHEGFSESVERLWETGFQEEVQNRIAGGKPLVVTGYSKGAALAPIAAVFLHERLNIPADRFIIHIFEPPRPGDVKFAKYFKATFPTALRYAYQDDIVPHLPPIRQVSRLLSEVPFINKILEKYADIDEWNYKSVGKLKFVNWKNQIVDGSPEITFQRLFRLVELVFKGKILKTGIDHIPCGHIYDILCGKDCPPR
ncbi:MAG: lipase family protein [Desulfobacteraceae bacterium]|nr:lipase family protein [Desulfobacteraceae bacterium]